MKNPAPLAHGPSRRSFLRRSAAFGFSVMPSYLALGRPDSDGNVPPSGRINLGCIGVGGRGAVVVPGICAGGHAKPVAFCDVDFSARRAEVNLKKFPGVRQFADFRVMLDKMGDDIDAVSVATPDHTHYVATLAAMQRGKHVYVEKPLTHSYREADLLMRAAEKYGVVTQMGNQGHTSAGQSQFRHLVERGIIRDIVRIDAWKSPAVFFMDAKQRFDSYPAAEEPPPSLDWDLWCGPAEKKPFNSLYHPFNWRGFLLYGNGMLGDWGAHIIDFAHQDLELGLPTRIEAIELVDHNRVLFPLSSRLAMHFPSRGEGRPACVLVWHDGEGSQPDVDEKFWDTGSEGEKKAPDLGQVGSLLHRQDGAFLIQRGSHASVSRIYPREKMLSFRDDIKVAGPEYDHLQSFTRACLGLGTTNSPFSVAAPLTKVLLLGVICQYLNENLEFDPGTETFPNHPAANDLLAGPPPRAGWEGYYESI